MPKKRVVWRDRGAVWGSVEFLPAGGVQITGFDRFSGGVQMLSFVRFLGTLQLLPAGQRQGLIVYPHAMLGAKT